VIATEQNPRALGKTVSEIDVARVSVHEKMKFSMLIPEVEQKLKDLNTRSVVLFGIEAHVCVLQTALDLLERQYEVHVLADGTSSTHTSDRVIAFDRLRQSGAFLTSSQSVLFQLMEDATFPRFKEIQALVKEAPPETGISKL